MMIQQQIGEPQMSFTFNKADEEENHAQRNIDERPANCDQTLPPPTGWSRHATEFVTTRFYTSQIEKTFLFCV